jgi:hypothetical protein
MGLGLVFVAAAWWESRRSQPVLRVTVGALLTLLVFFSHGVAFALYGILAAALDFAHWRQSDTRPHGQPRRIAGLARAWGLCLVQAIVPVALFLSSRTAQAPEGVTNAVQSFARLRAQGLLLDRLQELAFYRLETMMRVAEGATHVTDLLWMAAMVIALGLLWARGGFTLSARVVPAVLAAGLLVVICPPAMFGNGYVADRMPLFLALLLLGGLNIQPVITRSTGLLIVVGVLVLARLASIGLAWQPIATDLADFDAVAARLPAGKLVNGFGIGAVPHEDVARRCEMYPPLMGLRHRQIVPLFGRTIAQPLRLAGPLQAAQQQLESQPMTPEARAHPEQMVQAMARAGYDYVLLCQVGDGQRFPTTRYAVVAEAGRFRLLRVAPGRQP